MRLNEACELAITNGNCDPFADVTVRYTNDKTETQRTKVKKKTNSPVFDEAFAFSVILILIIQVLKSIIYVIFLFILASGIEWNS